MALDPTLVGSVMIDSGHTAPPNQIDVKAFNVSRLDPGLLDAVVRLVRLFDSPAEAQFLAPLVTWEIIYRLLEGLDAASAGSRVGYSDAAYFNREYKKPFGVPPVRDVVQLRRAAGKSAGLIAD